MSKVAIIGSATWGTALGIVLARKGTRVKLWTRSEEEALRLNQRRENPDRLSGISFPFRLCATSSLEEACEGAEAVIFAVPAQSMRHNVRQVAKHLRDSMLIVSAAKGLEIGTAKRMSRVIAEEIDPRFHNNICVLSGPNIAREIAQGLPAVTVIAAADIATAEKARKIMVTPRFCVFTSADIVGVELGGALKNIIAIGAGICDGLNYGDNTKAAFITRGLAEITCLGKALGADPLTFAGLAGLGDTITTCFSPFSRNRYVGVELAKGRPLEEITLSMSQVAEGVTTILAARQLAQELGIETPIIEEIYRVLYQGLNPAEAVKELMGHPAGEELAEIKEKVVPLNRYSRREWR
jgi:glycerol-3-phosphate dehydrogenase (NAD(P)+)